MKSKCRRSKKAANKHQTPVKALLPTIKEQDEESNETERQPISAVSRRIEKPVEEAFAIRPPKKKKLYRGVKKEFYRGVKKSAVNYIGF